MRRKKDKSNGITALYERLSRDDDNAGESNSIVHQKQMLEDYAMKHGFTNLVHFTDDGWSGATFDRPSWNRLVEGVKNGEITACICKDMSRIGRDHLQVGFFTDILFREKEVRFIAINNGIDSDRQETSEFAPFLNIMNEWFVRDTSKKIKAVLKSRGSSGNAHTSNIPPYGYLKDPENPDHWIIDEEAAEPKEPLSPTQEAAFLSFVQHDKVYQKYYDEIIILLGTGLRISELCGLTEADIDLDKQLINVDHQLLKIADVGYYVETPKTKSGNRVIPMSEKVLEAFQRVLNKRKYAQPVILEGYTKFLFLNRNGLPKVAVNYESMFRGLVRKYTKTQKVALPKVMTPHTLRHTFCTTLANAGMNPKALQYIMGHSNINMTLNYYAHTTSETSITEMKRLIA